MASGYGSGSSVLCLDIETTGINRHKDEILQISIRDGDGYELFSSYVKPSKVKRWPAVNRISPSDVSGSPELEELLPEINSIISRAMVIVTYNGESFDIPFLKHYGVEFPRKYESFDVFKHFHGGNTGRRRLTDCAKYYGYDFGGRAHDARADTAATLYCYNKMQEEREGRRVASFETTDEIELASSLDSGKKRAKAPRKVLYAFFVVFKLATVLIALLAITNLFASAYVYFAFDFLGEGISPLKAIASLMPSKGSLGYAIASAIMGFAFLYRGERKWVWLSVVNIVFALAITYLL